MLDNSSPVGLDARVPSHEWHSRRLWSLWEMLKTNASKFVRAHQYLSEIKALLDAHPHGIDETVDDGTVSLVRPDLDNLMAELELLGADMTAIQVDRCLRNLDRNPREISYAALAQQVEKVCDIFVDELSMKSLYVLNTKQAQLFEGKYPLFGLDVVAKYPSAKYEIDEAAKCMALRRSTAVVFHLMRCMEIGILAVARCLSIPDPVKPSQKSWGEILRAVRAAIDAKWPTQASRMNGDGALFDSLYASLDAVKNPLRNATMHVENIYTEEEAELISHLVKGFMKKLASRCDESGSPLA